MKRVTVKTGNPLLAPFVVAVVEDATGAVAEAIVPMEFFGQVVAGMKAEVVPEFAAAEPGEEVTVPSTTHIELADLCMAIGAYEKAKLHYELALEDPDLAGVEAVPGLIQAESDRLAALAAGVLRDGLQRWSEGRLPDPQAQDDHGATHAPRIAKDDARIDWSASAESIARQQ